MHSDNHTNISIGSNVYLLKEDTPFADHCFLRHVLERKAIIKLPKAYEKSSVQKHMSDLSYCAFNKSAIIGIMRKNNQYYQVIRCDKIGKCAYAQRNKCDEEIKVTYKLNKERSS